MIAFSVQASCFCVIMNRSRFVFYFCLPFPFYGSLPSRSFVPFLSSFTCSSSITSSSSALLSSQSFPFSFPFFFFSSSSLIAISFHHSVDANPRVARPTIDIFISPPLVLFLFLFLFFSSSPLSSLFLLFLQIL